MSGKRIYTDEQRRERRLASLHRYNTKKRLDPEFCEKDRIRSQKRYHQILKFDTIWIENNKKRSSERYYNILKKDIHLLTKKREANRLSKIMFRQVLFEIRVKLQALLGGKCIKCGIDDPRLLDFDHIDPKSKTMTVSQKLNLPWDMLAEEVKKCQLLCANCHRLKTIEQGDSNNTLIREYRNHSKKSP